MERMKQGLKRLLSTPPETHKEMVERRGGARPPSRNANPGPGAQEGRRADPRCVSNKQQKAATTGRLFFVNGGEVACRIRDKYEHMRVALYREAYFLLLVQGLARDSVYRQHDSTSR